MMTGARPAETARFPLDNPPVLFLNKAYPMPVPGQRPAMFGDPSLISRPLSHGRLIPDPVNPKNEPFHNPLSIINPTRSIGS